MILRQPRERGQQARRHLHRRFHLITDAFRIASIGVIATRATRMQALTQSGDD